MAKGKKKSRGGKGGSGEVSRTLTHFFSSIALVAGSSVINVIPSALGTSIVSMSDGFALFKIRSLKFRILAVTATAAAGCACYTPNPPVTVGTVMELDDAVTHLASGQFVWSNWVRVRSATYTGQNIWYRTRTGTYDLTEVVPCFIALAGSGTNVVNLELYAEFVFKEPISTSSTPMEVRLASDLHVLREYITRCQQRVSALLTLSGVLRVEDIPRHVLLANPAPPMPPALWPLCLYMKSRGESYHPDFDASLQSYGSLPPPVLSPGGLVSSSLMPVAPLSCATGSSVVVVP